MSFILRVDPVQMMGKLGSFLPKLPAKKPRALIMFEAGVYWMQRNKYSEAAEKFQESLFECGYGKDGVVVTEEQMEQIVIPALCNLAACNLEMKLASKAMIYCQEVLQRRPSHKRALYLQSMAQIDMGNYKSAMKYYSRK